MREILFRGKRKDNDEWVYGFYYEWHSKKYSNKKEAWIHVIEHDKNNVKIKDKQYEVDIKTVGQYTVVRDIHGIRIFTGDKVNKNVLIKKGKGTYWEYRKFIVEYKGQTFHPSYLKETLVIGNIY